MAYMFAAAPVDELGLWSESKAHVGELGGELPDRRSLAAYNEEFGNELATAILYQAIVNSRANSDFIGSIDAIPEFDETFEPAVGGRILVVPAMYYLEHPELGSSGDIVVKVARSLGIEAEIVPVGSLASVRQNGEIVADAIAASAERTVVFTISKGASDFRYALQHLSPELTNRVRAWVNISGTLHGSAYVDSMLEGGLKRFWFQGVCRAIGADFGCLDELRTTHAYWNEPMALPSTVEVLNVLPLSLLSHCHIKLAPRYRKLAAIGPNDGVMLPHDSIHLPGLIYPLWGCDHFVRTPRIGTLLSRLIRYLFSGERR